MAVPSRARRAAALAAAATGGLLALAGSIEAVARQLTRTRPVSWLPDEPLPLAAIAALALGLALAARAIGAGDRRVARAFVPLVFAALFALGAALQLEAGARLQSDGFYYYASLRSIAFDADVNLFNDYALLGIGDKPTLVEPTATGYAHSTWPVGAALLWLPFFGLGHLAAASLGDAVTLDGTSFPYRQAVVLAGLAYALAGAWCAWGLGRMFAPGRLAAAATALTLGGSFLLWYAVVEPTMTHAPALATSAAFVWMWAATHGRRTARGWAVLGALAGLMMLVRWQNAIVALLPAVEAAAAIAAGARGGRWRDARRVVACGALFVATGTLVFLPQMLTWKSTYGSLLAVSPIGPAIHWTRPHLVDALFSSRNGLFAMSPILYVGLGGLVAFTRRRPALGLPMLGVLAAMVWFNASISDWWGSDGYGARRFDGVLPLFVVGLAVALDGLRDLLARRPGLLVAALAGGLVVWNGTFLTLVDRGDVNLDAPIRFRDAGGRQARLVLDTIGHPFSYPASLWFALRNGVGPAAYDELGPSQYLGDPARPYGRLDIGDDDALLVGAGWHDAEREGNVTFRWAAREARLVLPLDHAAPLRVQLRARAFVHAGAPPQAVTVDTGRARFGPYPVDGEWRAIAFDTPAAAWRAGLNRVVLTFDRAARPRDVDAGPDDRELAAAVDFLRIEVIR